MFNTWHLWPLSYNIKKNQTGHDNGKKNLLWGQGYIDDKDLYRFIIGLWVPKIVDQLQPI